MFLTDFMFVTDLTFLTSITCIPHELPQKSISFFDDRELLMKGIDYS